MRTITLFLVASSVLGAHVSHKSDSDSESSNSDSDGSWCAEYGTTYGDWASKKCGSADTNGDGKLSFEEFNLWEKCMFESAGSLIEYAKIMGTYETFYTEIGAAVRAEFDFIDSYITEDTFISKAEWCSQFTFPPEVSCKFVRDINGALWGETHCYEHFNEGDDFSHADAKWRAFLIFEFKITEHEIQYIEGADAMLNKDADGVDIPGDFKHKQFWAKDWHEMTKDLIEEVGGGDEIKECISREEFLTYIGFAPDHCDSLAIGVTPPVVDPPAVVVATPEPTLPSAEDQGSTEDRRKMATKQSPVLNKRLVSISKETVEKLLHTGH